ncbi:MAG: uL22 family ribosomal protein [Candidatus Aenigmatarchaeota archaeon]
MVGYPVEVEERDVKAAGTDLRISRKKAQKICEVINNKKMKLERAQEFVQNLIDGEETIGKKTYKKAAEGILEVLRNAENNAEFKGIPVEKLRVKSITTEPGRTLRRRRRRRDFGNRLKNSNVKVVLERG